MHSRSQILSCCVMQHWVWGPGYHHCPSHYLWNYISSEDNKWNTQFSLVSSFVKLTIREMNRALNTSAASFPDTTPVCPTACLSKQHGRGSQFRCWWFFSRSKGLSKDKYAHTHFKNSKAAGFHLRKFTYIGVPLFLQTKFWFPLQHDILHCFHNIVNLLYFTDKVVLFYVESKISSLSVLARSSQWKFIEMVHTDICVGSGCIF